MRQTLGAHNARIGEIRSLLTKKGRAQQRAYAIEGPTLLADALAADVPIAFVVATVAALNEHPVLSRAESGGAEMLVVDDRTFARLSDLETPTGILAAISMVPASVEEILRNSGPTLLLADLNDPGNAGTLMRSAAAFGVRSVIAGDEGADCFGPKAVRAAMGATFFLRIAVASPSDLSDANSGSTEPGAGGSAGAAAARWNVVGLRAGAPPLEPRDPARTIVAVGHERHGLGRWEAVCDSFASLRMRGRMESLNAAMAGTLALYEMTR